MPSVEYWEGDPYLVQAYRAAHELRNEQRNQEMWLQGLYNSRAVAVGMGSKDKKTKKQIEYYDKPIRITPMTESEKAAEAEKARQKIIADLTGWEQAWKSKAR